MVGCPLIFTEQRIISGLFFNLDVTGRRQVSAASARRPQQPCFVCSAPHNGLPVAVEPPSALHQSDRGTDPHSVQRVARLSP